MPLPNVSGRILSKVIEYCKFHTEARPKKEGEKASKTEEDQKTFDAEFVKVDQGTLFELILVRPVRLALACPAADGLPCLVFGVQPSMLQLGFLTSNLQAANYLNIKALLDLTCLTVANMIKGMPF